MDSSSPFPALALRELLEAAGVNCSFHRNRMGMGDSNPAAVPHAAEDVQGDDRWMSQVRLAGGPSGLGGMLGQCCPGHTWDLEVTTACHTCVSCRDGAKEEGSSLMRSISDEE